MPRTVAMRSITIFCFAIAPAMNGVTRLRKSAW